MLPRKNKKSFSHNSALLVSAATLVLVFLALMLMASSVATAQQPPGPPRPTPTPRPPRANISFQDLEKAHNPNPVVEGQPLTYTVKVSAEGPLDGSSIYVELKLVGNQKYTGFDAGSTGWELEGEVTDSVKIKIGIMKVGEKGEVKVFTIAPTGLSRPYLQQSIYLSYNDVNGNVTKEFSLKAALSTPPSNVSPLPTPPDVTPAQPGYPTSGPFALQTAPQGSYTSGDVWYFPVTKHYLGFGFLAYWLEHGSVVNLGWPISEEFSENGQVVQYFERGVLEYHPDNPDPFKILLRALGREVEKAQPAVDTSARPDDNAVYFAETGHWLSGQFIKAWNQRGGLTQFGYPIAEPYRAGDKLVQWFERARFEVDTSRANQLVMLGLVGRESAVQKGYLAF
jgi:hypothetical protein